MILKEEVLEAEEKWAQAHLETDVDIISELMHPDYIIVKPDGKIWNRENALASYTPGLRQWYEAKSYDHIVNVYGDTAMVVGIWRATGVNNGEHFDYSARYTSLWVKECGKLRIVSDQSTEIVG